MSDRIAVLGAGIQGVCVALELSSLGYKVDLFDRGGQPICEASLWNEGKLHLGYIYANDPTGRTAIKMVEGASAFAPFLLRHCGASVFSGAVSKPFIYCVHKDSLLCPDAVQEHFTAVSSRIRSVFPAAAAYPGTVEPWRVRRLSDAELASCYDPNLVSAAFSTQEISVDPAIIASRLREAVLAQAKINFLPDSQVTGVEETRPNRYRVAVAEQDAVRHWGPYSKVVNALWADRLKIDATVGLRPCQPHVFRYKLAIHIRGARGAETTPSSTFMLGPFGDIVNFGAGRFYLSWYPACLVGESNAVAPPDFETRLSPQHLERVRRECFERLVRLAPGLGRLDVSDAEVTVRGGMIFNWGDGEIQNPKSRVHERWAIGAESRRGYLSIDTGKYVMAPAHALQVKNALQDSTAKT